MIVGKHGYIEGEFDGETVKLKLRSLCTSFLSEPGPCGRSEYHTVCIGRYASEGSYEAGRKKYISSDSLRENFLRIMSSCRNAFTDWEILWRSWMNQDLRISWKSLYRQYRGTLIGDYIKHFFKERSDSSGEKSTLLWTSGTFDYKSPDQ